MKPEEIRALAKRLETHNRWRRGEDIDQAGYTPTQYGLDLETAIALLRIVAGESD